MKRFAAHGPMIEDAEHGGYVRYEEARRDRERLKEIHQWLLDMEEGRPTARLTAAAIERWFNEDQSEVVE